MKKLVILLGVVGVSFSAVLVRFSDAPSLVLVFYRMAIAAAVTAPAVFFRQRGEFRSLGGKDLLRCAVGGIFLGLHFAAYFQALRDTGIGSAVVLVDTEVFFVALAGTLFLKERTSPGGWVGIGLTFLGSVIVAMGDARGGSDVLRGDLLALAGSVFLAVYTLIGRVERRSLSTVSYTFLVYSFAAATVAVIGAAAGRTVFAVSGKNLLLAAGMSVVCTLFGHSIFSWGLKYVKAVFISNVNLLEPVLAAIYGMIFFREMPPVATVAGGALIIGGIFWYSRHADSVEGNATDAGKTKT